MSCTDTGDKRSDRGEEIIARLLHLFVNRTDTYAVQREDGSYLRVEKPLVREDLERHLNGEVTVGTYQLDKDDRVKELVFDVDPDHVEDPADTAKRILEECTLKPSPEKPRFWASTVLLEASRYPDPSYHVRVLFEPALKAAHARWLGLKILSLTGFTPSQVEVFPKQAGLTAATPYGNFVKLPLGLHREKKRWSRFLDRETFKPLPNTVLLHVYGASFSEGDLRDLDRLLAREEAVQMRLPAGARPGSSRSLGGREEEETVQLLAKYWRRGRRNRLEMAFLGWCLKSGISYESAYRVIDAVTELCRDEERAGRLQLVKYHYGSRRSLGPALKGFTGLVEVIGEAAGR
jgi:hypothetical protein